VQVHAENGDGVLRAQTKTFAAGITGPEGHYISRPDFLEVLFLPVSVLHQFWLPAKNALTHVKPCGLGCWTQCRRILRAEALQAIALI